MNENNFTLKLFFFTHLKVNFFGRLPEKKWKGHENMRNEKKTWNECQVGERGRNVFSLRMRKQKSIKNIKRYFKKIMTKLNYLSSSCN